MEIAFTPPPPGVVEIYSDGSGRDSGPGGYGVILRYGEHEKELSGFEPAATSQRMELLAAIRGLEALQQTSDGEGFQRFPVPGAGHERMVAGLDPQRTTRHPGCSRKPGPLAAARGPWPASIR